MKIFSLFDSWRNSWTHLKHYWIAILLFLFGITVSIAAYKFYSRQSIKREHAEFERIAEHRLFILKDLFLATLEQVDILKQFFFASETVSQKEFHIFVHPSFDFFPNILALGWITEDQKERTKDNKLLSLEFTDLNQKQSQRNSQLFPMTYLEKSQPDTPLVFDLSDYHKFLKLFQKSRQNPDTVTISTTIHYFQTGTEKGFFLMEPIFSHEKNFEHYQGTIIGFSSFEDIFKIVRSEIKPLGINLAIYDITEGSKELLYWNAASILKDPEVLSPKEKEIQERWAYSHFFQYGDRTWELIASPTIKFITQQKKQYRFWEVPIIGILFSGLIASYFLNLANRRILIEKEVKERTNELANINTMLQQEIQERQKIEEASARQQQYLQRRHEALEYLTKLTISELRTALNEVILRTANVMQIDRVSVWFYEILNETEILTCSGLYILSTNSFSNHLEFTSTYFPHYFKALSNKTHLILPSAIDDEMNQELSSYFAVFHITSKLDIPIVFEGKLLGVLSCEETREHREWLLDDRHFGQTIADIIAIIFEQSARRKAEKAFQESEERLRFVTQKAIDGIISLTDKGEIISWNYGAEKMFGYNEMEMLGKSIEIVIPQDGFLLSEITTKPIELKGKHKEGHFFPVEVSHSRWQSGELYFDTIIIRDITERKVYEKKLIKAMKDAEGANEAKNEFLATISHELRTPLNAIIGFDQCLLIGMDGPINDAQRLSLKRIEKSSFHLLSLISDILDFSKIEAKKLELEVIPYNIVDLVKSSVEEMQSLANQKNLNISLVNEKPFILVEIDKVRMRQVLLNLLSNAVKFTEKGAITVTIINEPHQVNIQVADTGIGLTQEEIKKIFHPFSQADSSITRKYGGTGLGLVISKNIIDQHGGTLNVESEKGKGSTFIVTLPKIQE